MHGRFILALTVYSLLCRSFWAGSDVETIRGSYLCSESWGPREIVDADSGVHIIPRTG